MRPYRLFFNELAHALQGLAVTPSRALSLAEGPFMWQDPGSCVRNCPLRQRISEHFGQDIRSVAILPCSSFVPELLPFFQAQFPTVYLVDSYKRGTVNGLPIQSLEEARRMEPDLWFMTTRDPDLQDHFRASLPQRRILLAQDFFSFEDLLESGLNGEEEQSLEVMIQQIEAAARPLIVLDAQFFNNYCPTYAALENEGFQVFLCSRQEHILYAAPDSRFADLPFERKFRLNLAQRVALLCRLRKGAILMNHVSYLIPGFDAEKAIASMAYPLALMRLARVPCVLYLYDMISPITKRLDLQGDFLTMYRSLLGAADGLILNSNLQGGLDLLRRSLDLQQPMISFLRYNAKVARLAPREREGLHIALVGGMDDDLRDMGAMLTQVLDMRLHLHNYVQNHKTDAFMARLSPAQAAFFHNHASMQDQQQLIREVSRFHAGWILDNTYKWIDLLAGIASPLLRDLMLSFRLSTVTSSQMLLGAAGLPCILNRSMFEITGAFPGEFFLPMEASELRALPGILSSDEWSARLHRCRDKRRVFSADWRIGELTPFLQNFMGGRP